MPLISIVSPVYKAEMTVDELVKRLTTSLNEITNDYEIILVEDGSPDTSWQKIEAVCKANNRIKGIRLSRNFGQHHAITAGLDKCTGDWVVVMDCDLQDQPEEIIKLYTEAKKGYDIVFAKRSRRKDGFFKRMSSAVFYKSFSYLSGTQQDGTIANFGAYSRKAIDAINSLREPLRAFSPMARWVGFKTTAIEVEHAKRFEGRSSYNWGKLVDLGLNIAISYSEKPLKLVIKLGLSISALALLYTAYNIVAYYTGHIKVPGYASIIISIWLLTGLVIFILGIVGLYIGKTFEGIKNRPIYITDELINL